MKFSTFNSVRVKILMIAVIALIGFLVNLTFNYVVTVANTERLQKVQGVYFPVLEQIDSSLVRLDKIKETLNVAVSTGEADMLKSSDALAQKTQASFSEIIKLDPEVAGGVDHLNDLFKIYYSAAATLTRKMIDGSLLADQIKPSVDKMTVALKNFEDALNDFRAASYNRFTDTLHQADNASESMLNTSIILTTIVMLVVLMIAYFISRMISHNILSVVESLQDMAKGQGDLTKRLVTKSADEIGALVKSFNLFVEKLQHIIKEVTGSTSQLATAAEEMSVITATSTENINKQQRETDHVATAMNEMTATVLEVSKNAACAADSTRQADQQAQEGQRIVSDTVESINQLANEVNSVATVIQELEKNSENIGTVLEVIRGIAEQTNLLALNAAIEAARAGEQGRGFAVVADEVRNLASRTQKSTQEIQQMIEHLQSGSQNAVQAMNVGRAQANTSVEKAAKAGNALGIITETISNITTMNTQIAEASKQQSGVADEINQNIVNISVIAEESAKSTADLSQSSRILAELSTNLQSLVGQFRV